MLRLSPIILAVVAYAAPAHAVDSCAATIPPEAAAKAKAFLDLLVANKGAEAVSGVLDANPIWSAKIGAKEQMIGQIDAATKAYGKPTKWEAVCGDAVGTMAFREYYLVQYHDVITRWEFDFARTATGWQIGYFGFNDQIPTWF
ncbi:MAG: hypothetical protein J0J06_09400 [Sphingomonas sp.]|uniref:hypothetical protein n=1 Tax=Sphingomonas sp. TaxID=28214 RepID=UPI001AC32D38|nr:hypothetical protein [Sphingomonas sp.]MBN8815649.1 hypothetical protein [Sphingomonas sp.]